jgi:hypothetical protein
MTFKKIRTCVAWTTALLCSAALASSHIVDIAWTPEGRFAHTALIAAGKFFEICGKLAAGDKVRWVFTTGAPVDFNIHHHVGKEAVFHAKQAQVSSGGETLRITVAEDYCWMWTNKGKEGIRIQVELAR